MNETLSHNSTSPVISHTSMVVNNCTPVSDFIPPLNNIIFPNSPASDVLTYSDNQSIIELVIVTL